MKKDFVWNMDCTEYTIRNIPYELMDVEGGEVIDLDVTVKMEMIRELMVAERIPHDVDFDLVADMELDF